MHCPSCGLSLLPILNRVENEVEPELNNYDTQAKEVGC